ncbi:fasciclin domain-containing protein [Flavobacterium jejuense]|uniref:Fasciclin domain-containing protein n=1 Tax=Flavobacterium jejuense TaxID=1544455 RepID=A0ABX0IYR1_9FLAO|nr:fasciclin domain-containing protein [Flavobacterium jejuense]NHN26850.1 fasciclin domain-containing protein [Flavobacterium jejuense]
MKNFAKLIKLTLIATTFVTMFSCSDDDTVVTPVNNSIAAVTSRSPQFTTLVSALDKAGLVQTLDQNGPFTVFAPTNDAFNDFLTANNFASLDDVPVAVLKEILLNHVIMGTNLSTDLSTGYVKSMGKGSASDTNTLSLYIDTETTTDVVVNGIATVTTPNILAANGVIHEVNAVINLATIIDHARANPNFSTLVTVVTSTDTNGNGFGDQSAVATTLTTNTTPLTVFAPTNDAFAVAVGAGGFAENATPSQVSTVLQYHVTATGNVVSTTLTDAQVIPMITNPIQEITIDLTSPATPKITDQSATQATIVVVNVQCSNGIIHAIDKVLQPTL